MLIILPCAGGSASNYIKYKTFTDQVLLYEYPGHWSRYEEPLEMSIEQIVQTISLTIKENIDEEISILGHSMGGLIAWKLAQTLIEEDIFVKGLYIAACCPPEINPEFIKDIHDDADIKMLLHNIRQVPDKVLESSFFNEDLLPIIRNDLYLVKNYINDFQMDTNIRISVPITCLYGKDDPVIERSQIEKWRNYTTGEFRCATFLGDHFFVYNKENIKLIIEELLS